MMRRVLVGLALVGTLEGSLTKHSPQLPRDPEAYRYPEPSLFEHSRRIVGKPEHMTLVGQDLDTKQWHMGSTNNYLFPRHTLFYAHISRERFGDFNNLWFMITDSKRTILHVQAIDKEVPASYAVLSAGPFSMTALHMNIQATLRSGVSAPPPRLRGVHQYHALLWLNAKGTNTNSLCIANAPFRVHYPE